MHLFLAAGVVGAGVPLFDVRIVALRWQLLQRPAVSLPRHSTFCSVLRLVRIACMLAEPAPTVSSRLVQYTTRYRYSNVDIGSHMHVLFKGMAREYVEVARG